jgi:hypothetical protein
MGPQAKGEKTAMADLIRLGELDLEEAKVRIAELWEYPDYWDAQGAGLPDPATLAGEAPAYAAWLTQMLYYHELGPAEVVVQVRRMDDPVSELPEAGRTVSTLAVYGVLAHRDGIATLLSLWWGR